MIRPGGDVEDAHDRLRGDGLAGAGLAQHGERLARVHVVVDPVDGLGDPVPGPELHVQVAHFEQHDGGFSPQLRVEGVADRVAEHDEREHGDRQGPGGHSRACGALRMYGEAAEMSMPQETVGGLRPTPRYDRVASRAMYVPSAMVATTITGATALGAMCRSSMRELEAPSARAAWT